MHTPNPKCTDKLPARAQAGHLVGYDGGNSYRIYFPNTGKVVVSRDVKIDYHPESRIEHSRIDTFQNLPGNGECNDPFSCFLPPSDTSWLLDVLRNGVEETDEIEIIGNEKDTEPSGPQSETTDVAEDRDAQTGMPMTKEILEAVTHYPTVRRTVRQIKLGHRLGKDRTSFIQQSVLKMRSSQHHRSSKKQLRDQILNHGNLQWMTKLRNSTERKLGYYVDYEAELSPSKIRWFTSVNEMKKVT